MTENLIRACLAPIGLPIHAEFYEGKDTEYITFNFADDRPALRADDTDLISEVTMQVHYFTKSNPQANKRQIRQLLRAGGFTIISTSQFYEQDTEYYHVVVECWTLEEEENG
jgi:hypothetical protein